MRVTGGRVKKREVSVAMKEKVDRGGACRDQKGFGEAPHGSPVTHQPRRILVVAGEESGDRHASKLIAELKRRAPSCVIYAAGGAKMEAAGARLLHNLVEKAVLGSVEVLKSYFSLRRIFYDLVRFIEEQRPQAVILVDYPGFNIRLAKKIKKRKLSSKVLYYISPQVWAWGTRRKRTIARVVDRMIVILPFEKEYYADSPLSVTFVGHPMLDDLAVGLSGEELRARLGLEANSRLVAILPGSRWNEVRRHLPVMLGAARLMKERLRDLEFIMPEPPPAFKRFTESSLAAGGISCTPAGGAAIYDIINASDLVLVASGTATLETACLLKPMVIIYKVSWPTYLLGRMLVKLPYIGLVNVIAGRKIMPEVIQNQATPEKIASAALDLLGDNGRYRRAVEELRAVRAAVGERGASGRAAGAVIAELHQG